MATKLADGVSVVPIFDTAERLITVVIKSHQGQLRLPPAQACALQEQIGQIRSICQGPHCAERCGELANALARHDIGPSGIAAWPMCIREGDRYKGLGGIWIETQSETQPPLKLAPNDIPRVAHELTHIVITYWHDASWGGEDAIAQ